MTFLRELVETVVFALLVFLVVQALWRNFRVEGSSMEPTIHAGQALVVNRLVYTSGFPVDVLRRTIGRTDVGNRLLDAFFHAPRRGDVIIFHPPSRKGPDYIKRVIGIAGDRVEVRHGRAYVNGVPLVEPYASLGGSSWGPATVGWGQVFVLGDNREHSSDSRAFGMLPIANIVGQAWLSYWPPQRWGVIRHYDLDALQRSTY